MEDIYCFGGNPLDRASERRNDREWIAALLGDAETRILALRDLKPFTTPAPALDWQPVAQWRDQIDTGAPLIFLGDRKSTRLNSSHRTISYAVFCLKKKKNKRRCVYR